MSTLLPFTQLKKIRIVETNLTSYSIQKTQLHQLNAYPLTSLNYIQVPPSFSSHQVRGGGNRTFDILSPCRLKPCGQEMGDSTQTVCQM